MTNNLTLNSPPSTLYCVLIVDDHESMCEALEHVLADSGDFSVAGKIANADLAELFCEKLSPDLVFMDICTEGNASGLEAIKKVREKFPAVKIIAMSGFSEISYAPRAKENGAHAFIPKTKSLDFFVEAARAVMEGRAWFPEPKRFPLLKGDVALTRREMEILRLLCRHMNTREIAAELFISVGAVKFHKQNILKKTGFPTTVDLAFSVITNGWINPLF